MDKKTSLKYLAFWQKTNTEYIIRIIDISKYGNISLFCDKISVFNDFYQRFEGKINIFSIFDKDDPISFMWVSLDIVNSPLLQIKLNKGRFAERRVKGSIRIIDERQIMPEFIKDKGKNGVDLMSLVSERSKSNKYRSTGFLLSGSTNKSKFGEGESSILNSGQLDDPQFTIFDSMCELDKDEDC